MCLVFAIPCGATPFRVVLEEFVSLRERSFIGIKVLRYEPGQLCPLIPVLDNSESQMPDPDPGPPGRLEDCWRI